MTARVRFVVDRKPIGTNAAYIRAGKRASSHLPLVLSPEAQAFKAAVRSTAFAVRQRHGSWVRPETVPGMTANVALTFYNYRGDVDGPIKLCLDSLQGEFYENDKVVAFVSARKARDAGRPRVEFDLWLSPAA